MAKDSTKKEGLVTKWTLSDRGRKAESILLDNPYDVDAWGVLLREAQNYPVDQSRDLYERLVGQFPTVGKYWKLYIDQEMKYKNFDCVEKLFQRCLIKILNLDLWKTYLSYVKETKQALSSFREKMIQAYEFAIEKIGLDYASYPIWSEYINFLKAGEAQGTYAENQKISQIRKVYSRAVHTPIHSIEALWKEYAHFENSINKMLAEKLIHEKTREYQNAKRAVREIESILVGFNRSIPATPPTGSQFEASQKALWRKYINWEKTNPLKLDDRNMVIKRVMFAFEQCLLCFTFHPDVWYDAASYFENTGRDLIERGDMQNGQKLWEETVALYERATSTFLKNNLLLHFAYADFEESRKHNQKAHTIYNKLVQEDIDPSLVYCQYMKFTRRAEGIKECRAIFRKSREDKRSLYHVYICSALIEHYCNKDPKVATNIFELGLKKYFDCEDYINSYIDYRMAQNEDNNTRVLFEKLLNIVPRQRQKAVLSRYMEFEARFGDLSGILKIDKRLSLSPQDGVEERDHSLLIDRYKYMDLLPCNTNQLRSLGYTPRLMGTITKDSSFTPAPAAETTIKHEQKVLPKPDLSQMKPFKPTMPTAARIGPTAVSTGGVFPPPPAVAELLTQLPPPISFRGPFVQIDKLMESLASMAVEEETQNVGTTTTESEKRGTKRPHKGDSDDESSSFQPP